MGRLIDADNVKKMISDTFEKEKDVINSFWKMGTLMDKVDEIQTAYDPDKVVAQLEDEKEFAYADFDEYVNEVCPYLDAEYDDLFNEGLERAIEIVKGGGV